MVSTGHSTRATTRVALTIIFRVGATLAVARLDESDTIFKTPRLRSKRRLSSDFFGRAAAQQTGGTKQQHQNQNRKSDGVFIIRFAARDYGGFREAHQKTA